MQFEVIELKSPFLSVLLSFLFPGLGQLYTGQVSKGCLLIVSAILGIILVTVVVGIFWYALVWLFSMYDAYQVAREINAFQKKFNQKS